MSLKKAAYIRGIEWRKRRWKELSDAGPEGIGGRTVQQDILEWSLRLSVMIEESLPGVLARCKTQEARDDLWMVFDELSQEALKYVEVK